jgi:hypothetical protein
VEVHIAPSNDAKTQLLMEDVPMKGPILKTILFGITLVGCNESSMPSSPAPIGRTVRYGKAPTVADPSATVKIPLAETGLNLISDRAFSDGTNSVYATGVCGVTATIFLGGSGDMVLLAGSPRDADRKCASYPRKYTVLYPDGTSDLVAGGTMAVDELQSASFTIPVNSSALRGFHVSVGSARCEGVHWGARAGGDKVLVTRTSANTWHVTTQPYPNDQAVCKNTVGGQIVGSPLGHMALDLWIVSSRNLP